MMSKKVFKFNTALLSVIFLTVFSCAAGTGSTGADFLNINTEARSSAMGGTAAALLNGSNGSMANPANYGRIKNNNIFATHAEWISGVRYEYFGYSRGTKAGGIGVSAFYLHMSDIAGRALNGRETDSFTAYDMSISLSFGKMVASNCSMGAAVKVIKQKIEKETARGAAVDFGGLYQLNRNLLIGGSVLNLGPKMKFVKEEFYLPLALNIGLGYKYGLAVMSFEIKHKVYEQTTSVLFGAEYAPADFLALRGGYLFELLKAVDHKTFSEKTDFSGLGVGFGLNLKGYGLDYAFMPFGMLDNTHKITFTGRF